MADNISVAEWLKELEALSHRSDDGHTVAEIAENTGRSDRVIRQWLKDAARLGWLKVGRRSSTAIDGKGTMVPVYIVAKPERKGKR